MILRIARARGPAGQREAIVRYLAVEAPALAASVPGLGSFWAGLREDADALRFVLVSTWQDPGALTEAAGAGWQAAVRPLPPGAEMEVAEHYELVDEPRPAISPPEGSVLRILRAAVAGQFEQNFFELAREVHAEHSGRGLIAIHLGRRLEGDRDVVVRVTLWRTWAALREAAPEGIDRPFFLDALQPHLSDLSIEHYDGFGPRGDG
ncbi:MAG TPA: antibiotic biosynthesis monooxygenase [Candidatus Limnocylindrales bacterium]|jgi:heme-degrading monooxygenase HmoA|nr:antibiotic biosynthesis monooxygenase [Candidatus Limnocylindrales bacterium]